MGGWLPVFGLWVPLCGCIRHIQRWLMGAHPFTREGLLDKVGFELSLEAAPTLGGLDVDLGIRDGVRKSVFWESSQVIR